MGFAFTKHTDWTKGLYSSDRRSSRKYGNKKELASFQFSVVNCSLDNINVLKSGCSELGAHKLEVIKDFLVTDKKGADRIIQEWYNGRQRQN